jgi:hypothetical protein
LLLSIFNPQKCCLFVIDYTFLSRVHLMKPRSFSNKKDLRVKFFRKLLRRIKRLGANLYFLHFLKLAFHFAWLEWNFLHIWMFYHRRTWKTCSHWKEFAQHYQLKRSIISFPGFQTVDYSVLRGPSYILDFTGFIDFNLMTRKRKKSMENQSY